MRVYAQTDVGKIRPINEDAYYLPKAQEQFCAIADGMGGHNAGEVASAMAVELFSEWMRSSRAPARYALHEAVVRANAAIFKHSKENENCSGMGTTFTALCLAGRDLHIAHVGDSRAYLLHNDTIMRLTMDHTLVEEMVLKGLITAREAKYHPKRNYITRALGTADRVEMDLFQIECLPGDVVFLCTDGLSNHVSDKQILDASRRDCGWDEKLQALIAMALNDGGTDNITAMFAVFEEAHQ